ncbi:MAG TPA: RlpA-like double-psi beta-barrel domain-containing protein [bacterium]|nr:SPOR domain-containing protein [bacterium]MDX9804696.1 RlpA-like double-psi beta-barrel domain-containing protein [bacterium]HOG44933.1 RlpA-like double-psi beta-barrel domain-containing protein [bacterium]HPG36728.1 RlpA-like double-psi beta-barrel domain-containing protein [bacterium]HPV21380.1 RlpA-like double-psi beta-barrel domain-containing protein [bacterium]
MKKVQFNIWLMISAFVLTVISCESPYMIKHPVSSGDTYYLYATFYGDEFEGKTAADGSKFSNGEMTCAAKGFPFGTALEVQSLETGKSVTVTVTDRPGKNVVDLSKKAFAEIDNPEKGKIKAKIKVVEKNLNEPSPAQKSEDVNPEGVKNDEKPVESGKFYAIQLAAFSDFENAKKFQESQSVETYILKVQGTGDIYRVRYGRFTSKDEAENYKASNFSGTEAIVVEVVE